MFRKLFVDHPRAVNESYGEHWFVANRYGVLLIKAGLAAIVHGFVPGLLTRTGSTIVKNLHAEMTQRQPRAIDPRGADPRGADPRANAGNWQLEYEI